MIGRGRGVRGRGRSISDVRGIRGVGGVGGRGRGTNECEAEDLVFYGLENYPKLGSIAKNGTRLFKLEESEKTVRRSS